MNKKIITLGIVELNSVAKGIMVCDNMLKTANIELIESLPVCPGKYIIIVNGEVADVESAVNIGIQTAEINYVDSLTIPKIHPQIIPGLLGTVKHANIDAVGVLETFSVASTIKAADISLKASKVDIIEIRIAKGLGGKSFYTITGSVSNVTSAIEAGAFQVKEDGVLVNKVIIPRPHNNLKQKLIEW
jgi:microcompartment protein CcmL/EutN